MNVNFLSRTELIARRESALDRLGMNIDEARAQWDVDGQTLINGNWHDLMNLEVVKDCDYLLSEGLYE